MARKKEAETGELDQAAPAEPEGEIERAMRESGIDESMLDKDVRDGKGNLGFVDHGSKIVFYCFRIEPGTGKRKIFNRFWYRK